MFVSVHHSVHDGHDGNQTHNQRQFSTDHGYAETEIDLLQGTYLYSSRPTRVKHIESMTFLLLFFFFLNHIEFSHHFLFFFQSMRT